MFSKHIDRNSKCAIQDSLFPSVNLVAWFVCNLILLMSDKKWVWFHSGWSKCGIHGCRLVMKRDALLININCLFISIREITKKNIKLKTNLRTKTITFYQITFLLPFLSRHISAPTKNIDKKDMIISTKILKTKKHVKKKKLKKKRSRCSMGSMFCFQITGKTTMKIHNFYLCTTKTKTIS